MPCVICTTMDVITVQVLRDAGLSYLNLKTAKYLAGIGVWKGLHGIYNVKDLYNLIYALDDSSIKNPWGKTGVIHKQEYINMLYSCRKLKDIDKLFGRKEDVN